MYILDETLQIAVYISITLNSNNVCVHNQLLKEKIMQKQSHLW